MLFGLVVDATDSYTLAWSLVGLGFAATVLVILGWRRTAAHAPAFPRQGLHEGSPPHAPCLPGRDGRGRRHAAGSLPERAADALGNATSHPVGLGRRLTRTTADLHADPRLELSLRAKIGQMLLVGFRGTDADSASAVLADISDRGLGGVVLFSVDQPTGSAVRNIVSPEQLAALTTTLQDAAASQCAAAGSAPGRDGRGGRPGGPPRRRPWLPADDLGGGPRRAGKMSVTQQAGERIAETLRLVGITINLAPVVDLNVNPTNPIIGALGAPFSADPRVVTAQARPSSRPPVVGVLTTLKHFPGHGSSTGDTHLGVVDVTDTWSPVELEPFRNIVDDGLADAVLTAHVFNSKLDPGAPGHPFAAPTITGILREQIGWDGVVISDDMQMGAIRQAYGYKDALRLAILAGVDVLTIAQQQVYEPGIVASTIDLIEGMVGDGRIPESADQRVVAPRPRPQVCDREPRRGDLTVSPGRRPAGCRSGWRPVRRRRT